jgi:hypothetical protein
MIENGVQTDESADTAASSPSLVSLRRAAPRSPAPPSEKTNKLNKQPALAARSLTRAHPSWGPRWLP